jgi:ABC-type transporter Mla subunit MlaD
MNSRNPQNTLDDQIDLIARTVAKHSGQLEKHSEQLAEHTQQLDRITHIVVDHTDRLDRIEERLKTVVTREDHQEVMNTLDVLVKLAKKKDEELAMMSYAIQRQEKNIDKIKPLVGLA